jgi:hypothetical protein
MDLKYIDRNLAEREPQAGSDPGPISFLFDSPSSASFWVVLLRLVFLTALK